MSNLEKLENGQINGQLKPWKIKENKTSVDKIWMSNGFFASAKSESDITENACIKPKIQESDIISLILLLKI